MQYSLEFLLALAFAATSFAAPQQQEASVIADGQPQVATSAAAVSQITDGQIQAAPTAAPPAVSQIGDGQIQAPTSTAAAVTQIGDGQIQAPTSTAAGVTQIADGQVQAGTSGVPAPSANGTFTTPTPAPFTGAGSLASWNKELVVAAIGAAAGFALL